MLLRVCVCVLVVAAWQACGRGSLVCSWLNSDKRQRRCRMEVKVRRERGARDFQMLMLMGQVGRSLATLLASSEGRSDGQAGTRDLHTCQKALATTRHCRAERFHSQPSHLSKAKNGEVMKACAH